IGMTRAFMADHEWAPKAARGEADRIRPCLGLNQDCRSGGNIRHCAVNPVTGREARPGFLNPRRAPASRRIAVIGGGPGGLETARIAAARGHAGTLFERSDTLGG